MKMVYARGYSRQLVAYILLVVILLQSVINLKGHIRP